MNKENVKSNLKAVFAKTKELEKTVVEFNKARDTSDEASETLRSARGFLRKSIGDTKEVFVADINGKDYKIMPYDDDEFDVSIEEIKIIK